MVSLVPLLGALFGFCLWTSTSAAPTTDTGLSDVFRRAATDPTPFPAANLTTEFLRAAQFSRVVSCTAESIAARTCGPACDAISTDVEFLLSGGDDGTIPRYFVVYDPSIDTIFVSHQGTDFANFSSVLNDVEIVMEDINTVLIPTANEDIQVHSGFQSTFERTADAVLATVQSAIASTGSTTLVLTGHSLGASIALLDALMFKAQLDPSISLSATLFGLPRTGNQAFADFVDEQLGPGLARITNQHDPIPLLPPRLFGYEQPAGEIHIVAVDADGDAVDVVQCPGQENAECADSTSLFELDGDDHVGPYFDDISFGVEQCVTA